MENRKRAGRAVKGYTISSVAERFGLHPQTLRMYEREGLIKPFRSGGNTRYYSDLDLERLETILTLTRDMGVNLAGVDVILNLREQVARMQDEMTEFLEAVQTELSQRIEKRGDENASALIPRPRVVAAGESEPAAPTQRGSSSGGARTKEGR
jgi:MerR family transcriptional regulator/heat shock protein HspR